MTQSIFVLGLDDSNHEELRRLPGSAGREFHQLLTFEELVEGSVSLPDLLEEAQRQLDAFDGPIDAIVGYWDFPVSVMVPILCDRYGLPSADLEAVAKCEHKYWSRLEQQKVIDEHPAFGLIDLEDPAATLPDHMNFPAWIKPIKSTSSEGAHYIENDEQLRGKLAEEREVVGRLGGPFNHVLAMLELPDEIAEVGGSACMVEEAAPGEQYTVEGFSRGDRVEIYGVIDSFTYEGVPSFLRYQYPSQLPTHVQEKMAEVSRRVITAVGLSDSTFNIEYFWDPATEELNLLEINARQSQSHAAMFDLVDGRPNHGCMIDLALNREPHMPDGEGRFKAAAKWFLRRFADGVVHRVPTAGDVAEIEQALTGTTIEILVDEGDRLSVTGGEGEDSFSHALAEVFTGGRDEDELRTKYEQCLTALNFEIENRSEGA